MDILNGKIIESVANMTFFVIWLKFPPYFLARLTFYLYICIEISN